MKKILTFALILAGFTSYAQSTSIGVRTGASMFSSKEDGCRGGNAAWSNEVYFRRKTKSRIAFEAGLNYASLGRKDVPVNEVWYFEAPAFNPTRIQQRTQYLAANLGLQFDVTCPAMQACPLLSRFKSYIGVNVSPTLTSRQVETQGTRSIDGAFLMYQDNFNDFSIWTGISHTMVYNFCCRYYVSSTARFQLDPFNYFSGLPDNGATKMASLQVGVGYKL